MLARMPWKCCFATQYLVLSVIFETVFLGTTSVFGAEHGHHHHHQQVEFSIVSVSDGNWSDAATWKPARVPKSGDRVLISRGTFVNYDVKSADVVRLVQVVGTLSFARDRNTELNVGLLTIQHSDACSEHGFACEFEGAEEGPTTPDGQWPTLLIGTRDEPIPATHTAKVRLHFLDGMNRDDAPAIACCSGRMEIHGAPLGASWTKLGADAKVGATSVTLSAVMTGWRVGDEIIVTGSTRHGYGSFRPGASQEQEPQTERRTIASIEGTTIHLDRPLEKLHSGSGEFRAEVANLSRNVVIESADPEGVRGHTVYHRYSRGGISFARFGHLGKEGVLGRYPIHYHLVGDTMRGSCVQGAAIVDSHNRWVTIHGTQYLIVRDCVGYQSVGHGYFMEDGTEVYNLLDHNLGVHAYAGKRLPKQVLPFDTNEGAAFWWANGINTLNGNIGVESDQYGFRYDMQKRSNFDSNLPVRQPDGSNKIVDVRTLPIWRFDDNEAHGNFAGMVVAANGGDQPDTGITSDHMLDSIRRIDWTGPDTRHPHVIRNLTIWEAHYAFRPHSPSMLIDGLRIDQTEYGIYRPAFDNQVYRNVHLSRLGSEPFNRGMDDASAQNGSITVDGLRMDHFRNDAQVHPLVHMTDNNLSGKAECHFRDVQVSDTDPRRAIFNRGGSQRVDPYVPGGVPYYIHDYYGPGRHAHIVSTRAQKLMQDGHEYREEKPLTGDESRVAEVSDVPWPNLLDPIDDLPPATIITRVTRDGKWLQVEGTTHDNGEITAVTVNNQPAHIVRSRAGVVDWKLTLDAPADGHLTASAQDLAGNLEQTGHRWRVRDR
ncbi:MAG: G8 domain-containing protein [Planctomycetaceae bacterium]